MGQAIMLSVLEIESRLRNRTNVRAWKGRLALLRVVLLVWRWRTRWSGLLEDAEEEEEELE